MSKLAISKKFPQKRAFITGAASGLGLAFCEHLAQDGWTIGMADFNRQGLQLAVEQIRKSGGNPFGYDLDVSNRENYSSIVQQYLEMTQGIDLLINNAGVGDGELFENYSLENWDWMIDINVKGVINGIHFFAPAFIAQQSGQVINIGSAAGFVNAPTMSAYNLTKAAVISLSETLSYEWWAYNIQVSVLMPTFFPTQIMQHARGNRKMKDFAKKMMHQSATHASEVALVTLEKAAAGKLHIVFPKDARIRYFLKRYFPGILRIQILKIVRKGKLTAQPKKVH